MPRASQGPGPAVQRLLEQHKPGAAEPSVPSLASKPRARVRWSLIAADLLLILLCAALLNGVPLMAVFWKEWLLATVGLGFGGWLAWLSVSEA